MKEDKKEKENKEKEHIEKENIEKEDKESNSLEEKIKDLEIQMSEMKSELKKVKGHGAKLQQWMYKDLLNVPDLKEITELYFDNEAKDELFENIISYLKENKEKKSKIRTAAKAEKVNYQNDNMAAVSIVAIMLCVMGLAVSLLGNGITVLIILFAFLCLIFAGLAIKAEKNRICEHFLSYILACIEELEMDKKSKNL